MPGMNPSHTHLSQEINSELEKKLLEQTRLVIDSHFALTCTGMYSSTSWVYFSQTRAMG